MVARAGPSLGRASRGSLASACVSRDGYAGVPVCPRSALMQLSLCHSACASAHAHHSVSRALCGRHCMSHAMSSSVVPTHCSQAPSNPCGHARAGKS
eukprot:656519-Pyramimonas_sp.AAC.3